MLAILLLEFRDKRAGLFLLSILATGGLQILVLATVVAMIAVHAMRVTIAMFFGLSVARITIRVNATKDAIVPAILSPAGWDHIEHIRVVTHAPLQHVRRASTAKRACTGRRQQMLPVSLAPMRQNVDLQALTTETIRYILLLEVPRTATIVHGRRGLASEERATTI